MTPEKKAQLDAALHSGKPITAEVLAYHLNINRKSVPKIAEAFGFAPEGMTYPWLYIWRCVHGTEGAQLASHLVKLKSRYPGSVVLRELEDLESELRRPLIDFATMSRSRGKQPDTLAKALRQGRETLPFPTICIGPRTRHFRPLEVRLWVEEGIRLDLPKPAPWAHHDKPAAEPSDIAPTPSDATEAPPADPVKKAIFGGFAGDNRTSAT